MPHIAQVFECDEVTVRHWIEHFEAEGVEGLRDRPRPGRPRLLGTAARETIRQQLDTGPAGAGYLFGFWTVVTLAAHLATCLGLQLSLPTVRRALLGLGYRWRRPRHSLPKDPEAASKMWQLFERLIRTSRDTVVLCADECDVHLLPVLRAMWMRKGQQVRVPTPGTNRKRSIFGAFELGSGNWTYVTTERKRAVEFIVFLEQVLSTYPGKHILIVLDNASIHKAKVVEQWLKEHPPMELLYLPTYSGHTENPVEKVWWRLKGHVAANRLHGNIDSLVAAVHDFFAAFTPEAALRLAA